MNDNDQPHHYADLNPRFGERYAARYAVFLRRAPGICEQTRLQYATRRSAENAARKLNNPVAKLTQSAVRIELRKVGVVLNRTEWSEYRVNFLGGREATAYYTNDLEDARYTGLAMAARKTGLTIR